MLVDAAERRAATLVRAAGASACALDVALKSVNFWLAEPYSHWATVQALMPGMTHRSTHSSNLNSLASFKYSCGFSLSHGIPREWNAAQHVAARTASNVPKRTASFSCGLRSLKPYLSGPWAPRSFRGPPGLPRDLANVQHGGEDSLP